MPIYEEFLAEAVASLIETECNVNKIKISLSDKQNKSLIETECNVNVNQSIKDNFESLSLIETECNVNLYNHIFLCETLLSV